MHYNIPYNDIYKITQKSPSCKIFYQNNCRINLHFITTVIITAVIKFVTISKGISLQKCSADSNICRNFMLYKKSV